MKTTVDQLIENDPIKPLPFKVQSTFLSAFSDPFNLFMIIPVSIFTLLFGALFFLKPRWSTFFFAFLPLIFLLWFLYRYIRAILNREIEVDENGVRYREASRRLFFSWDEIETIRIEPSLGQITFWVNGKLSRIHEFGLPKQARRIARETIIQQAKIRLIKLED